MFYSFICGLFVKLASIIRRFVTIRRVRGSALIITLLVVMVISSIGLGVGRLTISEIKQTVRLEDSSGAETAAESGIEHGLLLYRFNHDVELASQGTDSASCSQKYSDSPTEKDGYPMCFDMGNGVKYELKIWHRNGNDGAKSVESVSSVADRPALSQDQTVEYDLHNPDGSTVNNLSLNWSYEGGIGNQKLIEIIPVDANNQPLAQGKWLFTPTDIGGNIVTTNAEKVRIKPYGGNLTSYILTSTDPGAKLDSRTTIIESTGYFGNTKRKLQVKIDRASGTILGIGDFVIYSGEGAVGQ